MLEAEALGRGDRRNGATSPERDRRQRRFDVDLVHQGVGDLPDVLFDIRIEDQDHSARLLREGVVMGAVTTERTPVPGCRVHKLGVMRYLAVASPAYIAQIPARRTHQRQRRGCSLAGVEP